MALLALVTRSSAAVGNKILCPSGEKGGTPDGCSSGVAKSSSQGDGGREDIAMKIAKNPGKTPEDEKKKPGITPRLAHFLKGSKLTFYLE